MEERPFRPFRIVMSNGHHYDINNHVGAWVLRNVIEIGIDPDADGISSNIRRCAILHIASVEDLPQKKEAA